VAVIPEILIGILHGTVGVQPAPGVIVTPSGAPEIFVIVCKEAVPDTGVSTAFREPLPVDTGIEIEDWETPSE